MSNEDEKVGKREPGGGGREKSQGGKREQGKGVVTEKDSGDGVGL